VPRLREARGRRCLERFDTRPEFCEERSQRLHTLTCEKRYF
jgi:hypothetical protein